jgi:homoserine dehydrogenase
MFYGRGAGELPTGSAVCGDVLAIANDLCLGNDPIPAMAFSMATMAKQIPISETTGKYYIRLNTADLPGVIGNLGKACGEYGVSLESVLQRCSNPDGTASIVLVTHQETTEEVACLLRVLES